VWRYRASGSKLRHVVASSSAIVDVGLTDRAPARISSAGGLLRCAAPAALAVFFLLAMTDFEAGVGSDAYHLPFVLRAETSHTLFLVGHVSALALYFLALLHILFRLGMREWPVLLLASILLGLTYLDSGHSFLADANIVGGFFTEAQVAIALVIVSLAFALNRRMIWAFVFVGVAFDAQYQVALWAVVALLAVSIALAWDRIPILRDWAIGGPIALLFATPAIVWLGWNIASGQPEPSQWSVTTASLQQWVLFISMLTLGLSAFSVLGPRARLLCAAFLGFFAVFIVGCVLPFVTDSQWLLTLRPQGADSLMQVLATVGAVAVVVQDMRYGGAGRVGLSLVIAASLLVSEYALPFGALAMLARAALAHGEMLGIERRVKPFNQHAVHKLAAPALLLIAVVGGVLRIAQPLQSLELEPQSDPGFVALVQWAKDATPSDSVFLVNGNAFDQFQLLSSRAVRLDDARDASTERLQVACRAGVDYFAGRASDGFDAHASELRPYLAFDQDGYFAIDARRYCGH
jgi:hypothetical protein